jgi:hypothetical protein
MAVMARTLRIRGLRVTAIPDSLGTTAIGPKQGRYGAVILEVYGPENIGYRNTLRYLSVVNDGGRWVFDVGGVQLPFERPEAYLARKVRDRFTFDLLRDYLAHLGVRAFEEAFYAPAEKPPSLLVERHGPTAPGAGEATLEDVRRRLGLA